MFCDEVKIKVKAGNGGDGAVSFLHEKYREFGGPDGGDGGKGGDIIFKTDNSTNTLYYFQTHRTLTAEEGEGGKRRKSRGHFGEDVYFSVPAGTVIYDEEDSIIVDMSEVGMEFVIAKGGEGGFGNAHFSTSVRQAPRVAELGIKGEERSIHMKLKLVADVGLVGLPNAGKSTLLSVITKAKPKIANYPFTTIIPNLGVVEGFGIKEGEGFVIADIPGLIEGASEGKGLGDDFLKHIERTRVILHLLDINSLDLIKDFETIIDELGSYNKDILDKPQIVLITKADTVKEEELSEKVEAFKKYLKKQKKVKLYKSEPFVISSVTHEGLKEIVFMARENIVKMDAKEEEEKEEEYKVFTLEDVKKDIFTVTKEGEIFTVKSKKIERFALKTDYNNPHSVARLRNIMERMGVKKALMKKGARDGHTVMIAGKKLKFRE